MRTFDLQVNGYAGVDFNADDLTADALHEACARLTADGVDGFLATIITDEPGRMLARIARVAQLCKADPELCAPLAGIHVEGPFISDEPGFAGAHPTRHARRADASLAAELIAAGQGLVRLVTLAPERDPDGAVIGACVDRGVRVAAGHTDVDRAGLERAIDAGVTLFTHLGNGCPRSVDRHDNIVQRALSLAERLWCCFIADGAHIPWFALRNYLRCATLARSIVVTDAIAAAGLGPGRHPFAGRLVDVGADLVPRAPDDAHLIGSATTMPRTIANLREHVGLELAQIEDLCAKHPRRALGLDTRGAS